MPGSVGFGFDMAWKYPKGEASDFGFGNTGWTCVGKTDGVAYSKISVPVLRAFNFTSRSEFQFPWNPSCTVVPSRIPSTTGSIAGLGVEAGEPTIPDDPMLVINWFRQVLFTDTVIKAGINEALTAVELAGADQAWFVAAFISNSEGDEDEGHRCGQKDLG